MVKLSAAYSERVKEEEGRTQEEVEVLNVGKVDPRRHLESGVAELMASSIIQCLGTMIGTVAF
jgi:26S proteasome regulatory subunit N11